MIFLQSLMDDSVPQLMMMIAVTCHLLAYKQPVIQNHRYIRTYVKFQNLFLAPKVDLGCLCTVVVSTVSKVRRGLLLEYVLYTSYLVT